MQEVLNHIVRNARLATFASSPQLSLGQLIDKMEEVDMEDECFITYDWAFAKPTVLDSWRGSYAELAIGYDMEGDYYATCAHQFLEKLKSAVEETFTGYKGGNFTMTKNTPLWVSNYSETGNTQVVGITPIRSGSGGIWHIVINTAYGEY